MDRPEAVTTISESTAFAECLQDADCACINKEVNVAGKYADGVLQTAAMVAVSPYVYKTKGPAILIIVGNGVASYTRDVFNNTTPPDNPTCDSTADRRLQPIQPLVSWDERH